MKTYLVRSGGQSFTIQATSINRAGGVLELRQGAEVIAWFASWDACVQDVPKATVPKGAIDVKA